MSFGPHPLPPPPPHTHTHTHPRTQTHTNTHAHTHPQVSVAPFFAPPGSDDRLAVELAIAAAAACSALQWDLAGTASPLSLSRVLRLIYGLKVRYLLYECCNSCVTLLLDIVATVAVDSRILHF
jgi:hypothetical protein